MSSHFAVREWWSLLQRIRLQYRLSLTAVLHRFSPQVPYCIARSICVRVAEIPLLISSRLSRSCIISDRYCELKRIDPTLFKTSNPVSHSIRYGARPSTCRRVLLIVIWKEINCKFVWFCAVLPKRILTWCYLRCCLPLLYPTPILKADGMLRFDTRLCIRLVGRHPCSLGQFSQRDYCVAEVAKIIQLVDDNVVTGLHNQHVKQAFHVQ